MLDFCVFYLYIYSMKTRPRGRPRQTDPRNDRIAIVSTSSEKRAFQDAADLAGVSLSTWIRERLRKSAIKELEDAAIPIAFLSHNPSE